MSLVSVTFMGWPPLPTFCTREEFREFGWLILDTPALGAWLVATPLPLVNPRPTELMLCECWCWAGIAGAAFKGTRRLTTNVTVFPLSRNTCTAVAYSTFSRDTPFTDMIRSFTLQRKRIQILDINMNEGINFNIEMLHHKSNMKYTRKLTCEFIINVFLKF